MSSQKESKVDRILHDIFQKGDSGQKYLQGSRSRKIDNWIMLDNYVQGRGIYTGSRIRALKIHSKRSKMHMSMKQHKKRGSLDLPKEFQKWVRFNIVEKCPSLSFSIFNFHGPHSLSMCVWTPDMKSLCQCMRVGKIIWCNFSKRVGKTFSFAGIAARQFLSFTLSFLSFFCFIYFNYFFLLLSSVFIFHLDFVVVSLWILWP